MSIGGFKRQKKQNKTGEMYNVNKCFIYMAPFKTKIATCFAAKIHCGWKREALIYLSSSEVMISPW